MSHNVDLLQVLPGAVIITQEGKICFANAAAVAVGGLVVFPLWPQDAPADLTDFNDLANWRAAQ